MGIINLVGCFVSGEQPGGLLAMVWDRLRDRDLVGHAIDDCASVQRSWIVPSEDESYNRDGILDG